MKITLNDETFECPEAITVEALLSQINRLQPGTALAINQTIIPHAIWSQHQVQDGDDILLFQAIAGG
ncbi:sulfur carrier protein ThiS [Pectobacterium parvum]|uniref:Sulfur carrier protein ThiS n=1 Tax=Pectobacterium parvum TaxID=2778550 RepID=A0AAP9LBZ4_9GAMM|nr:MULTISPECIES: sulfur carrier protein ThiS [Pectobacterium]GKW43950.1 sulfur carrier protein ThiS [Pectobacterium carotovorum subsp. carotovorum]KFX10344.1 thiamine biosynthesis protein ThiS [Pectobacterium parvum]KHS91146.1 thiamine biosynthesis protein ThiS [Pectobacterium parvum]MCU1803562.1 sulfur carrier protein ThiS [Pectobacterium parvum]QHQ23671.1 sulfur carrier protein ThiS [Pectobacterium parvum]